MDAWLKALDALARVLTFGERLEKMQLAANEMLWHNMRSSTQK